MPDNTCPDMTHDTQGERIAQSRRLVACFSLLRGAVDGNRLTTQDVSEHVVLQNDVHVLLRACQDGIVDIQFLWLDLVVGGGVGNLPASATFTLAIS